MRKTYVREMRPADVPRVQRALEEQNRRDGTSFTLPRIWCDDGTLSTNVVLALVSADCETGEAITGWVFERTVELTGYGTSARASVDALHDWGAVVWMLREKGYQDLHLQVPRDRVAAMEQGLTAERRMGMVRDDDLLAHFYRRLDPDENEALRDFDRERKRGDNNLLDPAREPSGEEP